MASKSKTIAESQIYNIQTDSTGAFDIPAGTTAQRPSSPTSGNLRLIQIHNLVRYMMELVGVRYLL